MSYVPHTDADREKMLGDIGAGSIAELFVDIPERLRFPELRLPGPLSEQEVRARLAELAERNRHTGQLPSFLQPLRAVGGRLRQPARRVPDSLHALPG